MANRRQRTNDAASDAANEAANHADNTEDLAIGVPGPDVRRHRRRSYRAKIAAAALSLAVVAGVGLGFALRDGADPQNTATLSTVDERAERASRGDARESASAAPSESPPVSAIAGLGTASPSPSATRKPAAPATKPAPAQPLPPVPASCNSYTGNRRTGCSLLPSYGFSLDQMPALDRLWTKESGWNHRAENTWSGAYGIPQALPGTKMATAGADWRTNPATQIRWGLGYIKGRYGTPAKAWAFWQANNWY